MTAAVLPVGDSNCPQGGIQFTAANGPIYLCSNASVSSTNAVTLTVTVTGVPQPGIGVYFQNPDSSADVFDWNPASTDMVSVLTALMAKVPGGYDAIRSHARALTQGFESVIARAASGRVVFEAAK